jgi:hypothetical protein
MSRTEWIARLLLRGVHRELERLRNIDVSKLGREGWRTRAAVTDAKAGIVVAEFAALPGRELSRAELKACQRAAERLEGEGKIVRLRLGPDGARLTHLQLVEGATL